MRAVKCCKRAKRSVRHESAGGAVACGASATFTSGAKRSASGALRRVAERRSLRSPSARAHSEVPMNKMIR